MPRKRARKPVLKAKASAKAEVVAKVTYQRKRITTEVIPSDVTRAKAGAWLNLISPITEWAGLKGDALGYKRAQLRIQQEAALENLAEKIRRKMKGRHVLHPLPAKVLVPALESISLEDPKSPLLEWWANLLVAGTIEGSLRPYLVDLMSKLGAEEAKYLTRQWELASLGDWHQLLHPVQARYNLYLRVKTDIHDLIRRKTSAQSDAWRTETSGMLMNAARNKWLQWSQEVGCVAARVTVPWIGSTTRNIIDGGSVPQDICLGLRLLGYHAYSETFDVLGLAGQHWQLEVLQFTELGVEFMKACNSTTKSESMRRPS